MSPTDTDPCLVLLSYDVTKANRSSASRVAHLIYGRADVRVSETRPFIQRAGVVWIGQSIFVVPEPDARELAEELRGLGAIVTMAPISVDGIRLQAFRQRATRRRPPRA